MRSVAVFLILMVTLASSFDYYNVTFDGPITEAQRAAVVSSGLEIVGYAGNFSYIARAPAGTMPEADGFVLQEHSQKTFQGLKTASAQAPLSTDVVIENITVVLFPGEDTDRIVDEISLITPVERYNGQTLEVGKATQEQLSMILAIPGVMMANERKPKFVLNDYAAPALGASDVWSRLGLNGSSTIVAVGDTGLDTGNLSTIHPDFRGRSTISPWCDGVKMFYCSGNPTGKDLRGHGTHVSGSVLGNGSINSTIRGMAYAASLFMQSLNPDGSNSIYTPIDIRGLYVEARGAGARLHSNSWGDASDTYSTDAQYIDDYSYSNKDFLILFAAGNSGPGASTLGSQANAKNAIAVGSVGTARSGPGPTVASSFSSRGPASDGRYKPDLMAPGENILSARSATGVSCTGGYDSYYAFCSGTSMATPLTTGSATLVRDYLVKNRSIPNPQSALIKAILIAGGEDLPGTGASPNNNSGFGRVNLSRSLPQRGETLEFTVDALSTGSAISSQFYLIPGQKMRAALVWTDPACTASCNTKALVNDLDLSLTLPNGTVFYGNSRGNPLSGADRKNNVEIVQLTPDPGRYVLNVTGYNVPFGPQEYALVVLGVDPDVPGISIISPQNATYNETGILVNLTSTPTAQSVWFWNGTANQTYSGPVIVQYGAGGFSLTAYSNDTYGNVNSTSVFFTVSPPENDTTPPSVSFQSPLNKAYNSSTVPINISAADAHLDRVWFYNGTANETYAGPVTRSYADGAYTLFAYANDTNGNMNSTDVTFTVDTAAPSLSILSPGNTTYFTSSVMINLTADDPHLERVWFFNTTGNETYTAPVGRTFADGTYTIIAFANDSAGNINSSNVTFTIATAPPSVSILSPESRIYGTTAIDINFTIFANSSPLDPSRCSYRLDAGAMNAIPGCANMTLLAISEGRHTIIVYANDTTGHQGSSNVSFGVDSIPPTIAISKPANATYPALNITLNFSASAASWNLSACWYSIDGGSNTSATCNNNSRTIWLLNGGHSITAYANDTNGVIGSGTVFLTISSTASVKVSVNPSQIWTRTTSIRIPFNLSFSGSPLANCSLINASGSRITNMTPTHNGSYIFSRILPATSQSGIYPYTVLCAYPQFSGLNDSKGVNVSYDKLAPNITALFNGMAFNSSPVNLSYSVTDNMAGRMTCYLSSGGKTLTANVSNGSARTETATLAYQGRYSIPVGCTDLANNYAKTYGYVILDSIAPKVVFGTITQTSLANGTKNVSIAYSFQEQNNISSASFSIDGALNGTLPLAKSGTLRVPLPSGNHSVRIDCSDTALNHGFSNKSFIVK